MDLVKRIWTRYLTFSIASPLRLSGDRPELPDSVRTLGPHVPRKPPQSKAHTWQTHGGFRH
jgi:hypothetical protein